MARAVGVALALVACGGAASASPDDAVFAAIRAADLRLATIGYRLATANADLCDRRQPEFGLLLHAPSQYAEDARPAARRFFRFDGPVGVEGVIAGSPASAAGMHEDDAILGIGALAFGPPDVDAPAGTAALDAILARIASLPIDRPALLAARRSGIGFQRSVTPLAACRTRFELRIASGFPAMADGETVQIGSRFLRDYPDDLVAVVVAHELAHNILHHRERLAAQRVSLGALAGFGRNARYVRQAELEADILSVSLLNNAGYDPASPLRFWRDFGREQVAEWLRSPSHPRRQDRLSVLSRALDEVRFRNSRYPAILSARDRPLDGDWAALLRPARQVGRVDPLVTARGSRARPWRWPGIPNSRSR